MKIQLPLTDLKNLCPLFLTNTAFPPGDLSGKAAFPKGTEAVLNGELLGTRRSYGLCSVPGQAGPPLPFPLGVEALAEVNDHARRRANGAALEELAKPAPDPLVLARYSGGGGLGESVNEFYTPRDVARAMWAATGKLPEGARVLDPACGVGSLLALAPQGSRVVGVELERGSAKIAGALLPHAHIHHVPFEAYSRASTDELFDLAILNPPYGPRSARTLDRPDLSTNERYFLQTALDRVKHQSGVMVALVNANLVVGHAHRTLRLELAMRARLVHAVLVPEGAFRAAGAGVTTAILTFRRHDVGVAEVLDALTEAEALKVLAEYDRNYWDGGWVEGKRLIERHENDGAVSYELRNAYEHAFRLGAARTLTVGRFDQPCYPGEVNVSETTLEMIQRAALDGLKGPGVTLSNVLEQIRVHFGEDACRLAREAAREASVLPIPPGTRSPDGAWVMGPSGWRPTDDLASPPVADALRVATSLSGALSARDPLARQASERLTLALDAQYRARHGAYDAARLSRLAGKFPALGLLLGHLGSQGVSVPARAGERLTGTLEEIAPRLADLLILDEESLAAHTGLSEAQALDHLVAHYAFTGDRWVTPGSYYSGNAYHRADAARAAARGHTGVKRTALLSQADGLLARVKPARLEDLNLSPRDPVIPVAALEAWVNSFLASTTVVNGEEIRLLSVLREGGAVKFRLRASQGDDNLRARQAFDPSCARALQNYLNHRTDVEAVEKAKDMSREQYQAERALSLARAQEYETRVRGHFQAWLPGSGYADGVVFAYNVARGGLLTPEANGASLDLPDWHGPALHRYQAADVRIFATTTGMINGYDVGVGKTLFALALTGLLRRQGRAQRPIIAVPAGLVGMWAGEAQACYPGWRVLPIGMSPATDRLGNQLYKRHENGGLMRDRRGNPIPEWTEDSAAAKRVKLGQFAAGGADLAIMSRETFTSIPLTDENRAHSIASDPEFLRRLEAKDSFDERGKRGRHDALKRKVTFQASCEARLRRDAGLDLPFEALGVDLIIWDEAHAMKNQHAPESVLGETPAWLGAGGESNRALDALYKARYTRSQGGATYALSASWLKNSPIEFCSMLNLVCDDLPGRGLATTADFMEQYLKIEPRIVAAPDGGVVVKPAVVGFQRLRELRRLMDAHVIVRKAGDPEVVTADGTPLHVPSVRTEEVVFSMTPEQAALYAELKEQARDASASSAGDAHLFSVMWRMRKLAADPALLGLAGENPRFTAIARKVLAERASGGKSLVFLGIGVAEGSLERLKGVLVAAGYPVGEIEVVTSGTHSSSRARADLTARYNYGNLSLVLGSDLLSEGFDLQIGTSLICEADLGWNYELSRQRLGRGARQGNTLAYVTHAVFLLRESFDLLMLSMVRGKKSWRDQLDGLQDEAVNSGADFSAEELVLLLSENVEQTRADIAEKKQALAELTGRAALGRQLERVGRAHAVKESVQQVVKAANGRKKGWTHHDHLRVTTARRALGRALAELDDETTFPLAKLVHHRGRLHWTGGVPFHLGMCFTLGDAAMTVTQLGASDCTVTLADGSARTLTLREVLRGARDYLPTLDERAYDRVDPAQGARALRIALPPGTPIHAVNGQTVNPVPRSGEVLTVVVRDGAVEAVSGLDKDGLRYRLQIGGTVIHYRTEAGQDGLTITGVAVLAPHERGRAQTERALASAAFHDRLLEIARLALAA